MKKLAIKIIEDYGAVDVETLKEALTRKTGRLIFYEEAKAILYGLYYNGIVFKSGRFYMLVER